MESQEINFGFNKSWVSDEEWKNCTGVDRTLWVTVTRVKDSSTNQTNGTIKTADIDLIFSNYRGDIEPQPPTPPTPPPAPGQKDITITPPVFKANSSFEMTKE